MTNHAAPDAGTDKNEKPAVSEAALWLSVHRSEIVGPLIPFVQNRFGLTAMDAVEALRVSHVLRYVRSI